MSGTKKEKLLIIGASGHGKVVADIALKMNKWSHISFLDDDESLKASLGFEVVGTSNDIDIFIDDWDIFIAIGHNETREKIQKILEYKKATIPVLVHPSAIIGEEVSIAAGTVIMAGAVINSSSKISRGCIINTSSSVDHDNLIEDFVHISPGARLAGTVRVGARSWLGIGSIASNNIKIVKDCVIGAGAVVTKDIEQPGVYVGIPAKKMKVI